MLSRNAYSSSNCFLHIPWCVHCTTITGGDLLKCPWTVFCVMLKKYKLIPTFFLLLLWSVRARLGNCSLWKRLYRMYSGWLQQRLSVVFKTYNCLRFARPAVVACYSDENVFRHFCRIVKSTYTYVPTYLNRQPNCTIFNTRHFN